MKTAWTLAVAVVLASTPLAADAVGDDAKQGLAVLRAENRAESSWWDEVGGDRAQVALIGQLEDQLEESGHYEVMPQAELAETLAAKRLWRLGELSPAGAIRLGRELEVRYLVATSLLEFGTGARGLGQKRGRRLLGLGAPKNFNTEIILRLIDTTAGRTVWSDSRRTVTPLRGLLSSASDDGTLVEVAAFESAVLPALGELVANLTAGSGQLVLDTPEALEPGTPQAGAREGSIE